MQPNKLPVGIDFGLKGGVVALHGIEVIFAEKAATLNVKLHKGETDEAKEKSLKSRAKAELAKKRNKGTGDLLPGNIPIFHQQRVIQQLKTCQELALANGYSGIFVAIEAPQTHIGKSHPRNYFGSGRGQNAYLYACLELSLTPVFFDPSSWKATLGLTSDKELSTVMAASFLNIPQSMVDDHDLCEAALLAFYVQTFAPRYLVADPIPEPKAKKPTTRRGSNRGKARVR